MRENVDDQFDFKENMNRIFFFKFQQNLGKLEVVLIKNFH